MLLAHAGRSGMPCLGSTAAARRAAPAACCGSSWVAQRAPPAQYKPSLSPATRGTAARPDIGPSPYTRTRPPHEPNPPHHHPPPPHACAVSPQAHTYTTSHPPTNQPQPSARPHLVQQDVGRHEHRVGEQPGAHLLRPRLFGLFFKLDHLAQPADGRGAAQKPGQLTVRGDVRLRPGWGRAGRAGG